MNRALQGLVLTAGLLLSGAVLQPHAAFAHGASGGTSQAYTPPPPVIQSVAIASPTALRVDWDDDLGLDPWVSRIDLNLYYIVNVYQDGTRVQQLQTSTTPLTVTGLQSNVRYCIGVQAGSGGQSGAGVSTESAQRCATTVSFISSVSTAPTATESQFLTGASAQPAGTNVSGALQIGTVSHCHVALLLQPC
jgi:hypothetical protein